MMTPGRESCRGVMSPARFPSKTEEQAEADLCLLLRGAWTMKIAELARFVPRTGSLSGTQLWRESIHSLRRYSA